MSGIFHWSMRNAAGLLFAAALIVLAASLIPALYELAVSFSRRASNLSYSGEPVWGSVLPLVFAGIAGAMWPLFGAALLYRIDRRAFRSAEGGARDD